MKLRIKTGCMPYAGCSKDLLITFCHDSQYGTCCSTTFPPQLKKCHTNEYTTEELGECADFDFASEKMIGSITFADPTDLEYIGGYQADWISLVLKDDNVQSIYRNVRFFFVGTPTNPLETSFGPLCNHYFKY